MNIRRGRDDVLQARTNATHMRSDDMAATTNEKKAEPAGAGAKATVRYVDRPECGETFADSVNSVFFDGQTMRIEFGITRMDDMKKDQPLTGRRYPACRLVLAPAAAIDLINKMQQTAAAMAQAGLVKQTDKAPAPKKG
jgi:hypothetical protein